MSTLDHVSYDFQTSSSILLQSNTSQPIFLPCTQTVQVLIYGIDHYIQPTLVNVLILKLYIDHFILNKT